MTHFGKPTASNTTLCQDISIDQSPCHDSGSKGVHFSRVGYVRSALTWDGLLRPGLLRPEVKADMVMFVDFVANALPTY